MPLHATIYLCLAFFGSGLVFGDRCGTRRDVIRPAFVGLVFMLMATAMLALEFL